MNLVLSALVSLLLGILDKMLPSIAAKLRADRADAKLDADAKKIEDAIKEARK